MWCFRASTGPSEKTSWRDFRPPGWCGCARAWTRLSAVRHPGCKCIRHEVILQPPWQHGMVHSGPSQRSPPALRASSILCVFAAGSVLRMCLSCVVVLESQSLLSRACFASAARSCRRRSQPRPRSGD